MSDDHSPSVETHICHLGDAWDHEWESIQSSLEGVTEEEARWQAPCYSDEPPTKGGLLAGTIHWHVWHLSCCKLEYASIYRDSTAGVSQLEPLGTFGAERQRLKEMQRAQSQALSTVTEDGLERSVDNGPTVGELVTGHVRHDAWHGGQIALIRRLYRVRG